MSDERSARHIPDEYEEFKMRGGCVCGSEHCDIGPEGGMSRMVRCSACHKEYILEPGRMVAQPQPTKATYRERQP